MMKAKKDGWEQVKKKLRSSTHPTILHQLYQGFHSVCWNHVPEIGAIRTREDELTAICFQEQTEIGWQHMMLGRMSKTWGDTNESMTKNFKHPQDADTWTTRVIRAMLVLTLNLWATRNKQTHVNKNGTTFVDKDNAVQKIQIYYKVVQPLVLAQD